ncbi:radical SAM protein [Streptomyces sp. SCUT-3]|uniref:radical SAM protein n=1 Tax=Streptomyces sp. SCUT-3 TaxID=2684469 RepID=UPI0015F7C40D|nr:radical SAM protein [Streptomyces sp. SCUT-3]QMV23055.1 radical SAM protein [Streptomyces sp. SCUT-3]
MELADLVGRRPVPGGGLLMTLTRRCPLRCAHCSTSSTPDGEDTGVGPLTGFVRSFTPADRPGVVLFTGGEPLLLPAAVTALAREARRAGTRSAVLSGMFFARNGTVPARIMEAVTAVDHFSASLDAFHEREVPRAGVFRAVHRVLDAGTAASFHITGTGPDDPYLAEATAAVRREFDDRVPMLVNETRPVGRAAAWAAPRTAVVDGGRVRPCPMAAWPVVAFDGTVVACCNQDVVDRRPVPRHLRLGHVAEDGWPQIRRRLLDSPLLRTIRTTGPSHPYARARHGAEADRVSSASPAPSAAHALPGGPCAACRALPEHPAAAEAAGRAGSGPVGALLDRETARLQAEAGPAALLRRYGCAPYADLVSLAPTPRAAS